MVPTEKLKNGHEMGPDSSDLAENVTPGFILHADSESGLRVGGFRANHPTHGTNLEARFGFPIKSWL